MISGLIKPSAAFFNSGKDEVTVSFMPALVEIFITGNWRESMFFHCSLSIEASGKNAVPVCSSFFPVLLLQEKQISVEKSKSEIRIIFTKVKKPLRAQRLEKIFYELFQRFTKAEFDPIFHQVFFDWILIMIR